MHHPPILIELQFWAPIEYYAWLVRSETVWLDRYEHYQKGSFRNRCNIGTSTGVLRLSVPLLKGKHQQLPIAQVAIDNRTDWQTQHWRSLQTAYGKAPFWEDYSGVVHHLYEKKHVWLWDFCFEALQVTCRLLGISPNLKETAEYWQTPPAPIVDLRNSITPQNYDAIELSSLKNIIYPQVFEDRQPFLPNLSILDLIFCAGYEAKHKLIS